jgi:hypothetical protein
VFGSFVGEIATFAKPPNVIGKRKTVHSQRKTLQNNLFIDNF